MRAGVGPDEMLRERLGHPQRVSIPVLGVVYAASDACDAPEPGGEECTKGLLTRAASPAALLKRAQQVPRHPPFTVRFQYGGKLNPLPKAGAW